MMGIEIFYRICIKTRETFLHTFTCSASQYGDGHMNDAQVCLLRICASNQIKVEILFVKDIRYVTHSLNPSTFHPIFFIKERKNSQQKASPAFHFINISLLRFHKTTRLQINFPLKKPTKNVRFYKISIFLHQH